MLSSVSCSENRPAGQSLVSYSISASGWPVASALIQARHRWQERVESVDRRRPPPTVINGFKAGAGTSNQRFWTERLIPLHRGYDRL